MNDASDTGDDATKERLLTLRRSVAQELALDCATAEVVAALDARRVPSLLLKGPVLARWLYEDVTQRRYRDIDLLVPPDYVESARRVLAEAGFTDWAVHAGFHAHEDAEHHEGWLRSVGQPIHIELHHTFPLVSAAPAHVWLCFSRDAEALELAGTPVQVPAKPVRALIVALHAAAHGREDEQVISDLNRALERADIETWRSALELARELRVVPVFSAGLGLAPAGRELTQVLGITSEKPPRVVRLLAATAPDTALGIERFVAARGPVPRLTVLARALVPSRGLMRLQYRIAGRGRWGLALAYSLRPLDLGRKLPRGILAWLAAARPRRTPRPKQRG